VPLGLGGGNFIPTVTFTIHLLTKLSKSSSSIGIGPQAILYEFTIGGAAISSSFNNKTIDMGNFQANINGGSVLIWIE
jgi:hypothetical protein